MASPKVPSPSPPAPEVSEPASPGQRTRDDYIFAKISRTERFGIVYLAKDIHTREEVAIKVLEKRQIMKDNLSDYIKREQDCLNLLSHVDNGFVKLHCTFQDETNIYIVLSYAKNGELLRYITKAGSLQLDAARFYAAELLLAIESMHACGVIHKDLRPKNILLNANMHLEIAEYGEVEILLPGYEYVCEDDTDFTFAAAHYLSPELLCHENGTKASDLWSFGCILYNMISGLLPFRGNIAYILLRKILKQDYDFPESFPSDAKDLIERLILLDSKMRLGASDVGNIYHSIRCHPFFEGINWETLWQQTPPKMLTSLAGGAAEEVYKFPDHLKPGLGPVQMMRLWNIDLSVHQKDILSIPPYEQTHRLEEQARNNIWHRFVDGELILKQGLVKKNRGLFARERMLLLTTGPRLFYVDPSTMILKGEISWCPELRAKAKNFKNFCVYTPNRKYHLEDPAAYALEWVRVINEARVAKYGQE